MTNLYVGLRHGKAVFYIRAANIKSALHKLSKFSKVARIEELKKVNDIDKNQTKGKIIYLH